MATLSYSFHIGSSGRTHKGDRKYGADNSYKTIKQAENAFKHNLRAYISPDRDKSLNITLIGSDNPKQALNEFREAYKKLFDPYLEEYNKKQTREDRKIDDYLEKIEADKKKEVAVESIIQVGDKDFWDNYDIKDRQKMTEIFKNQLELLQEKAPNYHIVNATIHYDEASPHLHIIGIPYSDGYKNGMYRQVAKNKVFNKISLAELQTELRKPILEKMQEIYGEHIDLKAKEKGRNYDLMVDDYKKIKVELEKDKDQKLDELKKIEDKIKNYKEDKIWYGIDTVSNLDEKKIIKKKSLFSKEKTVTLDEEDYSIILTMAKDQSTQIKAWENYSKQVKEEKEKEKQKRIKAEQLANNNIEENKKLKKIIQDKEEQLENSNKLVEYYKSMVSRFNNFVNLVFGKQIVKEIEENGKEFHSINNVRRYYNEKEKEQAKDKERVRFWGSKTIQEIPFLRDIANKMVKIHKEKLDEIKGNIKISKNALKELKEEIEPKKINNWIKEKENIEIEL